MQPARRTARNYAKGFSEMSLLKKLFGDYSSKEIKRITPLKDKVLSLEKEYAALSDEELQAKTPAFKERLQNGETLDDILPEAFATCREAAWRVLGMRHYPVQILGGIILIIIGIEIFLKGTL